MLWPRVDNRKYFTALFLALVALAWLALFTWGQSPYARYLSHDELGEVAIGLSGESLALAVMFVGGWTVMTVAMMLPTSLPLISMFQRMTGRRSDQLQLLTLLIAGYIAVWSLFGLAAHTGDRAVHAGVQQFHWLEDNAWLIAAGTLLVAGVYQFTPLKYICLDKCRSPLSFITEHWHGSNQRSEALKLGMHHGLFCVGCCWSLMMLMFALGVGSIGWMLVLGTVMAVEKNMPWGRRLSAPLGVGLIVAAVALAIVSPSPEVCAHSVGCE